MMGDELLREKVLLLTITNTPQVFGRPQWKTPASRSRQYVTEICRRIGEDKIELETACVSVKKLSPEMAATTAGWEVVDSKGASRVFDEVCTGTTTREHVCSEVGGGAWGEGTYAEQWQYHVYILRIMTVMRVHVG